MLRSVAAIAVGEGRVFVARRKPGGELGLKWEFPGGKVEEGEDDRAALIREVDEEFGVAVRPLKALGEASFIHHERARDLCAWSVELDRGRPLDLREHLEVRWVGPEELESLDLAGSDRQLLSFVLPLLR